MLRKLALSLAIAGVLGIPNANALGLGEINIRSALNEPLEAEIRLLQVRDLSPMQIQPRMADVDDFSLAGVTRSRFISDVRFQVNVFPDGTGVIRMTSSEPIREPFLNFLVEVNWPSGRLVREYTLLLDPPVFDPAPVSRPVQAAASSAPMPTVVTPAPVQAPAPAPTPIPTPVAAPVAAAPSNVQSRVDAQTQIYVDVRDTMWELALKHRPDSSITPQQMMLALQRRNPGSFPTGNVNMLKAGTVMEIPSSSEIRSLSAQQANAEFVRQTELWRQGRAAPRQAVASAPAVDGSREEGKPEAQPEAVTEEVPSELRIVTPPAQEETVTEERAVSTEQSAPDVIDPGEQSAADADAEVPAEMTEQVEVQEQRIEQIDTRLMMTEETIDMQRRDIQELQSNFNELLELFQQQSRILELKDQQIAELQAQLAARDAPPPAATGGGFMESVERFINSVSSIPYIGPILGGVLALLLALLFIRKRKSSSKEDDPGLIRAPKDLDTGDTAAKVAPAAAVAATAAAADVPENSPAQEEEKIVHQPLSAAADSVDDLSDLDLDMDLDIPETSDVAETAEEVRVLDEEFDLSADDYDDLDELDLSSPEEISAAEVTPEPEASIEESSEESSEDSSEEDLISGLGLEDKDDLDDLDDLEFTGETAAADQDDEESLSDDVDSLFDLDFEEGDSAAADVEDEFEAIELSDDELADDLLAEDELSDSNEIDLGTAAAATAAAGALAASDDSDDEFDSDLEGLLAGMDDEDADSLQEVSEDETDSVAESTADDAEVEAEDALSLDDDFDLDSLENELDQELDAEPDAAEEDEGLPVSGGMQLDDVGSDLTDSKEEEASDTEDDFLTAFEFDDIEDQDEASLAVSEALSREAEEPEADDIDSLLSSLDLEDDEPVQRKPRPGEVVEDELTANIAHDLELELDSELDDLLNSTDDDIAIEETDASDTGSDDILEGLGLLDGADENETKLDLARAYIEMDDVEGARDILGEILREGNDQQREEAEELLKSLS